MVLTQTISYALAQDEKQSLVKELERLESHKDFLQGSTARKSQELADKVRENEALQQMIKDQQVALARAQSALGGYAVRPLLRQTSSSNRISLEC